MKNIALIFLALSLSACVSTNVRDFTDPDYTNYTSVKLLVEAPGYLFDDSFSNELKDINVIYASANDLFMPTRTYTAAEKLKIMRAKGFDSLLTIGITSDNQSKNVVGYSTNSYTNANASAYSTGYGSAYATGSSSTNATTIPIVSHRRNTHAQAKLYDIKSGRVIWVGDIDTSADGSLYMSNTTTVNSMTEQIVSSLLEKGHLKKKQKIKK